ncbi:response regulator transcription factor [Advenella sp. RU8]|uniref:response regulator transcription factor n=1 Tax=Advenella sp. RU8 TaxID=3399575 RepID=UPI003AAF7E66
MSANTETLPIHIVDDDVSVREALLFLLQSLGYDARTWPDGRSFLEGADIGKGGVVILDIRMPHLSGEELYQHLLEANSTMAVIVLTGHADVPMAVNMLKKGVVDFLQKPVTLAQMDVALGNALAQAEQNRRSGHLRALYESLSPREKQVTDLVLQGKTNKVIADELYIAVRTVEVQRSSAMQKMQVDNLPDFVRAVNQACMKK